MGVLTMSNNSINKEEILQIGEYITKNYQPREEDREEDELMQKIEELEASGIKWNGGATMSVMTSLPPMEREMVSINDMAKILGIGHNSIRRLVRDNPDADYIFTVGNRTYLKRELFIKIMLGQSTI